MKCKYCNEEMKQGGNRKQGSFHFCEQCGYEVPI